MAYNYEYPYVDPNRYNVDWVLQYVKEAKSFLEGFIDRLEAVEAYQKQIDELRSWIDNFDDTVVRTALEKYIQTMIIVSISESGYIIYTIPDSWKDIIFNTTGLDIDCELEPDYGHLVLSY